MSRPLRILYTDAWYHVINRGASRVAIFHSNNDYKMFLDLLLQIHRRYRFEIHAYCLMPNHFHLLLREPENRIDESIANISYLMKVLLNSYAKYFTFNRKTNSVPYYPS